jgi:hypothetical protein
MTTKSLGAIVELIEGLTDGLKLDIKSATVGTDKTGEYVLIGTVDGKKYRTYSGIVIETMKKVIATKFDFTKDTLKAQVKEVESQATGQTYFTLVDQK